MDTAPGKICIVCHREFANDVQECPFDMVKLSEKDSRIGTIFDGKYEILDFIGVGGLSRVYKARHKELNRAIALKIPKSSELIDLQRFRREAVSVGLLDHENIARVYSFAVSPQGNPYMAQEFLDGRDLADLLAKEGPLSPDRAVSIFIQVAAALEHAHSRNIIHRDIKPGNIMVLWSPGQVVNVKVVDFGMAKLHLEGGAGTQSLTQDGEIFGTKQYISPEQYSGQEADPRADIYSFGITMYESVLKDGKIPDIFRSLIARATESDPEHRIQSAKELKEELLQIKETLRETGLYYVEAADASNSGKKDLFGTFYFWSMLIGMTIVGVCAAVVVKQRMAALEVLSRPGKKASISRIAPLSLEATKKQAERHAAAGNLEASIQLYEDWLKRNENNADKWQSVCSASNWLASYYSRVNKITEAEKLIESATKLAQSHEGSKPASSTIVLELKCALAAITCAAAKYEKSLELSREAIALCDSDPSKQAALDMKVLSYLSMCRCYTRLKNFKEAEAAAKTGMKLAAESDGINSVFYGEGSGLLVDVYLAQNKLPDALQAADRTVFCYRKFTYSIDTPYLNSIIVKALVEMKMDRKADAERDYTLALRHLLRVPHSYPVMENEMRSHMRKLATYLRREADLDKLQPIPI